MNTYRDGLRAGLAFWDLEREANVRRDEYVRALEKALEEVAAAVGEYPPYLTAERILGAIRRSGWRFEAASPEALDVLRTALEQIADLPVLAPFESGHQEGPRRPGGEVGGGRDQSSGSEGDGDGDGEPPLGRRAQRGGAA